MCAGCFSGSHASSPTPALNGSATRPNTCCVRPSRFALATACMEGVLDVEHQVELAGRHLPRDGVAGGEIALGVVGAEADVGRRR